MSRFRRWELVQHSAFPWEAVVPFTFPPKTISLNPCFPSLPSVEDDDLDFALHLLNSTTHKPPSPAIFDFPLPFDSFDTVTDLIQVEKTPFGTKTKQVQQRDDRAALRIELCLQSLFDRVSALEPSFHRLARERKSKIGERKYTWSTEIKDPEEDGLDRKYKWTTEIKDGKKKGRLEKNFKYTAEIKGKGEDSPFSRKYTFTAYSDDACDGSGSSSHKEKEKKDKKKPAGCTRLVEIQDNSDHGALVLRQALTRRVEKLRGKRKELSPQDAAMKIQMSFKAYLLRRSQALRALRELAIAKTKLKEIRALFNNFSYRRRLTRDAEERQKFSEKIIVLLLTVDAIEGADMLVRAAKKSMVDELEAMLDVVDPQPGGRSHNLRRRTFDMPDSVIQKELAAGVCSPSSSDTR